MISISDLTSDIKYFGAKIGEGFCLIGYVDIKHGDNLVFHANLTQRDMAEVVGFTAEQIQELATTEANEIVALESTSKIINDYITLYNLGLYGV